MITSSDFVDQLEILYPGVKFYNGSIDKQESRCVGVYVRGGAQVYRALGGIQNTSYSTLPVSILVHWSEKASQCNTQANSIYSNLFEGNIASIGGKRVIDVNLLDPCPIDVGRDNNNIVEMVIRANIIYER